MGYILRVFPLIVGLILISIHLGDALPSKHLRVKRSLTDADDFLGVLTEEIKKIPVEQFAKDPILIQKADRVNSVSSYWLMSDSSTEIYKRKSSDAGMEVIVLDKDEDQLVFKKLKRRYVVLRRKPGTSDPPQYYVVYAYLR
jgi:hypothetical protein